METRRPPRGADLVADVLVRAGAPALFTASSASGAGLAPLVEAGARRGLRVVEAARGTSAGIMATAAALLGDAPALAAVAAHEAGPALAEAARHGAPLVLVTERALPAAVEARAKASLAVHVDAAAHWSAHACQLALTDPRGPVHLVVTAAVAAALAVPVAVAVRPAPLPPPEAALLDRAADLLAGARRPVLVTGRQCRTADIAAWVRALAESVPAPALSTAGGKGALPDPHPLSLGLAGGHPTASSLLAAADLAVLVGLDPDELEPDALSPAPSILHLAACGREWPGHPPRMEVVGEIALIIEELAPRLRGRGRADWDVAALDRLKRALAPAAPEGRVGSSAVARVAREATAPGTIAVVAAEAETPAVLAAWQVVAPRELVVAGAPPLPDFAGPAAVGAAIARPGARVVCFATAGQLRDARGALETAARLVLPIVVLAVGGRRGPETLADLGEVQAAGDEVTLRLAVERALSRPGPALIDARTPTV
jgi:acetolactate synthase-1/2/3 large subunit